MNIAVTNPIRNCTNPKLRHAHTPGAYLHVKQTNQAKPGSVQPVSYVAPPRATHRLMYKKVTVGSRDTHAQTLACNVGDSLLIK